jgi:hypothetical protein
MSPLLLLVCAPALLGAVAFFALLLGGAAAGTWEAIEERHSAPPVRLAVRPQSMGPQAERPELPAVARAA